MLKRFLQKFLVITCIITILSTSFSVNAANFNLDFEPACESVLLINLDTDTVIYSKNADQKRPMASLTKIMTYILTVENVPDIENTTVVVKKSILNSLLGTGCAMSGIKANEVLSVKQLLYCVMIHSGNDATLVLADLVGNGSIKTFVEMMNKRAAELGCHDTHFTNPHGLHDDDHYTTAQDLIKITKHAMTLPNFMEISSQVTSYILGNDRYPLVTTNSLIDPIRGGKYYYKHAKGIKSGYDKPAGRCLVSSAVNNGYTYLCVALGGFSPHEDAAMIDSRNLYEWAFKNLELKTIVDKNKPLGEIKLNLAWHQDTLQLFPSKDCPIILPKNVKASSVNIKLDSPEFINAPILTGQKIGTATLSYANSSLATVDLVANSEISRSKILFSIYIIKNIITSTWFKLTVIIAILLIVFYIVYIIKINKRGRKTRKKVKAQKYKYKA